MRKKDIIICGVLSAMVLFPSIQSVRLLIRLGQARAAGPLERSTALVVSDRWQKDIEETAQQSGVMVLSQLNLMGRAPHQEIQIQWEAPLQASGEFLSALENRSLVGPAVRMQMSSSGSHNNSVSVKMAFQPAPSSSRPQSELKKPTAPLPLVFWFPVRNTQTHDRSISVVRSSRPSKKEILEKAQQEEQARLELKKRMLEENISVTGIVNNGHETMAVLNIRSTPPSVKMVREGDVVSEARVSAIDGSLGEVRLEVDNKLPVIFRLNTGRPVLP